MKHLPAFKLFYAQIYDFFKRFFLFKHIPANKKTKFIATDLFGVKCTFYNIFIYIWIFFLKTKTTE